MRVEAIKVDNGFLIPLSQGFQDITQDRILLEVEIIDPEQADEGYAALDEIIGCCETGNPYASVQHDQLIYGRRAADDLR
jgi:hypothetical protein